MQSTHHPLTGEGPVYKGYTDLCSDGSQLLLICLLWWTKWHQLLEDNVLVIATSLTDSFKTVYSASTIVYVTLYYGGIFLVLV